MRDSGVFARWAVWGNQFGQRGYGRKILIGPYPLAEAGCSEGTNGGYQLAFGALVAILLLDHARRPLRFARAELPPLTRADRQFIHDLSHTANPLRQLLRFLTDFLFRHCAS